MDEWTVLVIAVFTLAGALKMWLDRRDDERRWEADRLAKERQRERQRGRQVTPPATPAQDYYQRQYLKLLREWRERESDERRKATPTPDAVRRYLVACTEPHKYEPPPGDGSVWPDDEMYPKEG